MQPSRIALVSFVVALLIGMTAMEPGNRAESASVGAPGHSTTQASPAPLGGTFALVLVIDAARYDEITLSSMPNLARLVAQGATYSRAWVGQLPSITETSHATIGTGVFPSRHLVLGDTWRIPGTEQMSPNLLNGQLTRTGYIGQFVKQKRVPTIADAVHQRYPGSFVATMSGHKIYAADALGAGAADYVAFGARDARGHFVPGGIPSHEPSETILRSPQLDLPSYPRQPGQEDAWTTTLAEKFLFKYHPRLIMVNFPEVDIFGHIAGTSASVMQPLLSNIDHQIGRLVAAYGRAKMLSRTNIIVTADHAMVPALHTVASTDIERVIQQAGAKALYVGHGDYSELWLNNPAAIPRTAAALVNANLPQVSAVFLKDHTGTYVPATSTNLLADPRVLGTYRDLLNTFNSPESPDIVLMYNENTITMTPSFVKNGRRGDHGGATWGAQHIPLLIAGPGIKKGYSSDYPARLVDIAPTVETLMGIQPQHQDGVPLADAMTRPPSWAVVSQDRTRARMMSDVQALVHEAELRPNPYP